MNFKGKAIPNMSNRIRINTLRDVDKLVAFCKSYSAYGTVDICCGRYIVDGCSYMGVVSMIGNEVEVKPNFTNGIATLDFEHEFQKKFKNGN